MNIQNMILAALQVVVDTPTNNAIDNFLAIAKKDIAHAFLVIQKSRIRLYHLLNSNGELANVLLAIEWEYLGLLSLIHI